MPTKPAGSSEVSVAVQDYAKAIYALEAGGRVVSTNALSDRLQLRPGSVSGMLAKLVDLGLIERERYHGVRLTGRGKAVALEVIRHHRLLELFLVESLEMSWDEVHEEAERLEHVISEELEELIAAKLGQPTHDPHGDPIPSRELAIAEAETVSLESLESGAAGTFVRVSDVDPEMLRFLSGQGIAPGARFELIEKQPFDGPLFVRFGTEVHVLGATLARAMRVRVDSEP
jgi:DtxR family Mn-dependent transcriptional regulator